MDYPLSSPDPFTSHFIVAHAQLLLLALTANTRQRNKHQRKHCNERRYRCPSFHVASWLRRSSSQQAEDQAYDEDNEKDEEQHFGDLSSAYCDAAKPEYRCDQCDNKKYCSPIQHKMFLSPKAQAFRD